MANPFILSHDAISQPARRLLEAYDVPLENFVENFLSSTDNIFAAREARTGALQSLLALHVPEGEDYYALSDDAETLDNALITWRDAVERTLAMESLSHHQVDGFTIKRFLPDGVLVEIQLP